ncbi:MAG TPA: AraC family transcriptional regulator [Candidatus Acidoferrum sp.]|nr:AraC family transcriptional regulator [Candidatus Acidoferrum sp.]
MTAYQNRGYLEEDYRLFHLRDSEPLSEIDYHYHEFHKVLLFVSGSVSYVIEGKHYPLNGGDVVLVPRGCVHKPEVGVSTPYERYVLYLYPGFLHSPDECPLDTCFALAEKRYSHILRLPQEKCATLQEQFCALDSAIAQERADAFGASLLAKTLVIQLLIALARASLSEPESPPAVYDDLIVRALQLVNDALAGDVRAEKLAEKLYVSKYHLMRRFKAETGYTLHQYVTNKRMLFARDLIARGTPPTDACFGCGFGDYSAFARAYKKQFGRPPRGG